MPDLSVIIPARNELWLNHTIADVLAHSEADTEVIVILDGQWPAEPIPDNDRVILVHLSESIGQRAACNLGARISQAKYLMKLDAHCSVGQGFDRIMLEDMQSDWTMVPKMYNLHCFDWVCRECGHRRYQSPSGPCEKCGGETERELVWYAKPNPETTAMRFDRNLKFAYWPGYKKRQSGDLVDTMSILGACFLLTRERWFDLDICDEEHGSWGQQGTEVACKTWLSGGRLVCTKKTWMAHMFRTQGGDFGFPYPLSGREVGQARTYSKQLWRADDPSQMPAWDKAIYPLAWLIDKFAPVPDWDMPMQEEVSASAREAPSDTAESQGEPTRGILYYTDNRLNPRILRACQRQLEQAALPITAVSLQPMNFGAYGMVMGGKRGPLTLHRQILAGLESMDCDIVFFAEHDVLYHPSHWQFTPERADRFYYNTNVWKVRLKDGHAVWTDELQQTSGLCAYRSLLLRHYRRRVAEIEANGFDRHFEPGEKTGPHKSENWQSEYPNLDIRHKNNLTRAKWHPSQFRNQQYAKGWKEANAVEPWYSEGELQNLLDILEDED